MHDLSESVIRDALASHLDALDQDLTLVATEYYLPEAIGTRGFIDILAYTSRGTYAIVEVKRSDQSARQALHEVLKYHEALKHKLGLRDSELQSLIVSTDWKELLLPFSAFVARAHFSIKGYSLEISSDDLTCIPVMPLRLSGDRLISPIQSIRLYADDTRLQQGLFSHRECFAAKGISDYVLLVLKAPDTHFDYCCRQLEAALRELGADPTEALSRMKRLDFMIYSAIRRLPEHDYWKMLNHSPELKRETEEFTASMSELDRLEHLESNVTGSLRPFPDSDEAEIGYPSKFKYKLLAEERWTVTEIIRGGAFAENRALTDEQIVSELGGDFGSQRGHLKRSIDLTRSAEVRELVDDIDRCFADAKCVWRSHIRHIISTLEPVDGRERITIEILFPRNILLSLFRQLRQPEAIHLPMYAIDVGDKPRVGEVYLGILEWDGTKPDFQSVMNSYFEGVASNLALTMCWGGLVDVDEDIMATLGLRYATVRAIYRDHILEPVAKLEDFDFKPGSRAAVLGIKNFLQHNSGFARTLVEQLQGMILP